MTHRIDLAILCVSGYTTRESDRNGIDAIYRDLFDRYAGPRTLIWRLEWDFDYKDKAIIVDRDLLPNGVLAWVGHSFGGLRALDSFCRYLMRPIDLAGIIDGIPSPWRWDGFKGLLRTLRLARDPRQLPDQVRRAVTWRQNNAPWYGRAITGTDSQHIEGTVYGPGTSWTLPHERPVVPDRRTRHDTIDSLPAIRTKIVDRVGSLVDARRGR